jgi:hypothetical protein
MITQEKIDIRGTVEFVHRDANNNIKARWTQPIDSHIAQYWRGAIWGNLFGETYTRTAISGGTGSSFYLIQNAIQSNNGTRGILVGTSDGTLAYTNVNLGARIDFGSSSNQLAADAGSRSFDFSTGVASLTRTFTNQNAVTTPTVRECGISMGFADSAASCLLIVRDLLGSPVTLLFAESLGISYTIDFDTTTENFARFFGNIGHGRSNVNVSFIDTNGIVFSSDPISQGNNGRVRSSAYEIDRGIILGTGTTSVNWGDYALESIISNGSNSGELVYYATIVDFQSQVRTDTFANGGSDIYIKRMVQNKGSSNVDVSEMGLYAVIETFDGNFPIMYNRYVLSTAQTIQPNESAVFTWAIRYEF